MALSLTQQQEAFTAFGTDLDFGVDITGPAEGNLLLVFAACRPGNATGAAPTMTCASTAGSYTEVCTAATTNHRLSIFAKVAGAVSIDEYDVVVTPSHAESNFDMHAIFIEVEGWTGTPTFDTQSSGNTGGFNEVTVSSGSTGTLTAAGDLVVSFGSIRTTSSGGSTLTNNAGLTEIDESFAPNNRWTDATAWGVSPNTDAYNVTWSAGGLPAQMVSLVATFTDASGGTAYTEYDRSVSATASISATDDLTEAIPLETTSVSVTASISAPRQAGYFSEADEPAHFLVRQTGALSFTTPDTASISITGDREMRLKKANFNPFADTLAQQGVSPDKAFSWVFFLGPLSFQYSTTGSNNVVRNVTWDNTSVLGGKAVVRSTWTAATGTHEAFYQAEDGTWTSEGTSATGSSVTMFNSSSNLQVGAFSAFPNKLTRFYWFELYDGINGTLVERISAEDVATQATTSYTSPTSGATITINRTLGTDLAILRSFSNGASTSAAVTVTATDTLVGPVEVSGSADSATGASGSLSATVPLSGSANSASGATGSLTATTPLVGQAASASGVSADTEVERAAIGATGSASSASGALTATAPLAGQAGSTTGATGALTATVPIVGATDTANGSTGALTANVPLAGASPVASGATADVTITSDVPLVGQAPVASGATGALTAIVPIVGSSATGSGVGADTEVLRASSGQASSAGQASGSLDASAALSGSANSASDATAVGTLQGQAVASGQAPSASGATGSLSATVTLSGSAAASSGGTGALSATVPASASTGTANGAIGDTEVERAATGSPASATGSTGALVATAGASGQAPSAAGLTGVAELQGQASAAGSADTASGLSGAAGLELAASSDAGNASGLTASPTRGRPLSGTTSASSGASGSLTAVVPISGSAASSSGATGDATTTTESGISGDTGASTGATASASVLRGSTGKAQTSSGGTGTASLFRTVAAYAPTAAAAQANVTAVMALVGQMGAANGIVGLLTDGGIQLFPCPHTVELDSILQYVELDSIAQTGELDIIAQSTEYCGG